MRLWEEEKRIPSGIIRSFKSNPNSKRSKSITNSPSIPVASHSVGGKGVSVGVGGMVRVGVAVLGGVGVNVGVGRSMTLKTAAAQRGFPLQPAHAQIS